ncbi:hypothetical protein, partial [Pseudomonas savastanoi]|uniref:hypothetical protein n=1 Tax=Pseudomonas savastanoi TaxID=29438 RepID=UPI001C118576
KNGRFAAAGCPVHAQESLNSHASVRRDEECIMSSPGFLTPHAERLRAQFSHFLSTPESQKFL